MRICDIKLYKNYIFMTIERQQKLSKYSKMFSYSQIGGISPDLSMELCTVWISCA